MLKNFTFLCIEGIQTLSPISEKELLLAIQLRGWLVNCELSQCLSPNCLYAPESAGNNIFGAG